MSRVVCCVCFFLCLVFVFPRLVAFSSLVDRSWGDVTPERVPDAGHQIFKSTLKRLMSIIKRCLTFRFFQTSDCGYFTTSQGWAFAFIVFLKPLLGMILFNTSRVDAGGIPAI